MKRRYITGVILLILAGAGFRTCLRTARFADNPLQVEFLAAARRGDVRELERLHLVGAGINDYCTYQRGAVHGGPALVDAIIHERPSAVAWLLERGADVTRVYATDTPLEMARSQLVANPASTALWEIVALLEAGQIKEAVPAK